MYFMLKYPSKKICTQTLSRLYTKHKIRRKKIKITKLLTPVLRRRIKKQTE
jgi:ribosomal protein L20A (L18A)